VIKESLGFPFPLGDRCVHWNKYVDLSHPLIFIETQAELLRCLNELIHPKITRYTEEELKLQDEAYLKSLPKPRPRPSVPPPKLEHIPFPTKQILTEEQKTIASKWQRAVDMVRKGRFNALQQLWGREGHGLGGIDVLIPEWVEDEKSATLLHVAAMSGQEEIVRWLLVQMQADPCIPLPLTSQANDASGTQDLAYQECNRMSKRTAYDVASTKEVRNVFRRWAGEQPDKWDWFGAAHVPSVLTKEAEEEKDERKKTRRKGLKDKIQERMAKEKESMPLPSLESPREHFSLSSADKNRLGGKSGAIEDVKGLSSEMVARVERERRARAAEARLKNLNM